MKYRNKIFSANLFKHSSLIMFRVELHLLHKNDYCCHSLIILSFWKYTFQSQIVYWRSRIGRINH